MAKSKPARRGGAAKKSGSRSAAKSARKTSGARKSAAKRASTGRTSARRTAKKATQARKTSAGGTRRAAKSTSARGSAAKSASARGRAKSTSARGSAAKQTSSRARRSHEEVYGAQGSRRAPTLDRQRRTISEADVVPSPPSSLDLDRRASAARTGRAELNERLHQHTSTGPAMTGGDVDADWMSAETVGDEAPGGDNPTPDQDIVDEIGKAVGIEYDDDEELQGGDEIVARDRKRWELDPASREDFEDE